jgi:NDP-sugar pyrophosphorylase family protein
MKAVILAGGQGTRLQPYTAVLPKPLMPLGESAILEIVIHQLVRHGVTEIVLAVGYLSSLIQAVIGDGRRFNAQITYSREEVPLGTAGPLSLIPDLDETFLLMNGDVLTTLDFSAMIAFHRDRGAVATLGVFRKSYTIDFGVLTLGPGDLLTGYDEKPTIELAVSTGIYVLEPQVVSGIQTGQRKDLPDLMRELMAKGESVVGYPFDGHWLDIGRHDDYRQAAELFEANRALFLPAAGDPTWRES